jgi:sulfite reductase (NADPH) hemoprotein beta-component
VADVQEEDKTVIDTLLEKFGIRQFTEKSSAIRLSSLACVAFNTCPLALAEAQRYIPTLITKLEPILNKHQLMNDDIILRMTGCPNGCGRATAAEIGLIGTAYGQYNLHIGGDRLGLRLNKKYQENLNETQLLETLDELFGKYINNRLSEESFGDFANRQILTN